MAVKHRTACAGALERTARIGVFKKKKKMMKKKKKKKKMRGTTALPAHDLSESYDSKTFRFWGWAEKV